MGRLAIGSLFLIKVEIKFNTITPKCIVKMELRKGCIGEAAGVADLAFEAGFFPIAGAT